MRIEDLSKYQSNSYTQFSGMPMGSHTKRGTSFRGKLCVRSRCAMRPMPQRGQDMISKGTEGEEYVLI